MRLVVFIVFLVLYFYENGRVIAQPADNPLVIDYSATDFLIERPFTISLLIRNSDSRPTITFPDIPGLVKQGTSYSTTRSEAGGSEVTNQLVVQTYLATRTGAIRIAPFTISVNNQSVRAPGLTLTVRAVVSPAEAAAAAALVKLKNDKQAAFLQTSVSQPGVYTGEGLRIRVSFFVAENYPYELKFDQLEQQVAAIVRKIRPVNAWEESDNITELTPRPTVRNGRKYIEYRIYQATFFLLATRTGIARQINLPAVPLTVIRKLAPATTPVTPASASNPAYRPTSTSQVAEMVTFVSQPVVVQVRPLPRLPGVTIPGQMAVGTFRMSTEVDHNRVSVGQSVRYDIRIEGRGNIASIQAPQAQASSPEVDIFPPQVQEQIGRTDDQVSGFKSFRYFLIPKQKGTLALAERFFWVYFDPQLGRYDTLRPQTVLNVGEASDGPTVGIVPSDTLDGLGRPSIYAGLELTDSTEKSINWPVLIRATANVVIILMILGTLFVFARK
ncbi:BatD family protein [Fibrella forsythiae]|uniref:BatD family protein n=1 Tax=Fibrella forsythiae TaxID=2817061 RepID=A0ABS3JIN6_9BACT|nr:BatD family protein [Fibrella forsythiae]MBO0949868.1 BatD family protein [Fibrella forsythiae]